MIRRSLEWRGGRGTSNCSRTPNFNGSSRGNSKDGSTSMIMIMKDGNCSSESTRTASVTGAARRIRTSFKRGKQNANARRRKEPGESEK